MALGQLQKYLSFSLLPPYINQADFNPLIRMLSRIIFQKKSKLAIEDKRVANYLLPLPSSNALISLPEANSLYKVAYFSKSRGDVVEIGTWRGGSALILASGIKEAGKSQKVNTIDPYTKDRDPISKKYLEKDIKKLNLKGLDENYDYSKKLFKRFNIDSFIKLHKKKLRRRQEKMERKNQFIIHRWES